MDHSDFSKNSYNPKEIAWLYSFRGKIWRSVEWARLNQEISQQKSKNPKIQKTLQIEQEKQNFSQQIDPSIAFLQTKKNRKPEIYNQVIKHYTKPNIFEIQNSSDTFSEDFLDKFSDGVFSRFAKLQKTIFNPANSSNLAYFNQLKLFKILPILESILGLKSVYIVGSHALEIATEKSDIDLVFITHPGMVLFVRFWAKILLKITNTDIHSLHLEIAYRLCSLLNLPKLAAKIQQKQINFHTRKGLKIDVGIISQSWLDIQKIYPKQSNKAWLYGSFEISNKNHQHIPKTFLTQLFSFLIKILSFGTFPIIYPLAILGQLFWAKIKKTKGLYFKICAFFTNDFPEEFLIKV